MSVAGICSLGLSVAGYMVIRTVVTNLPTQNSQLFLISSLSGAIFGAISSALINGCLPTLLGHIYYPLGIGFCSVISIDLFTRLHISPIGHWESIQNGIISNIGAIAGLTTVMLVGHVILNIQELLDPQRDMR
jgi:hypothetical protein